MTQDMNIEKVLFPDSGKLIKDELGNIKMQILDAELDSFECVFNNDGCVEIDTSENSYIVLSLENLYQLIFAIQEAEDIYNYPTVSDVLEKMHLNYDDSIDVRLWNSLKRVPNPENFYITPDSDKELLKVRNFGTKCLERLKYWVKK